MSHLIWCCHLSYPNAMLFMQQLLLGVSEIGAYINLERTQKGTSQKLCKLSQKLCKLSHNSLGGNKAQW